MNALVPQLAVGSATVIGLLAIIWQLWWKVGSTLSHIRRLMIVAAIFYAARSADWLWQASLFRAVTIVVAAFFPLMVLLVVENLMRQHAPRWMKFLMAGGGCGFATASLVTSQVRSDGFVGALFAFQLAAFAAILWMIRTRDRAGLSSVENIRLGRATLVLIVLIPLLASDFLLPFLPVPVSMSGLALLAGCWVLVNLHNRVHSHARITGELLLLVTFALCSTACLVWYLGLTTREGAVIWAMLIAFTLAGATIVGVLRLRWRTGPMGSVTRGLTQTETFATYLADLQKRDLECHLLSEGDLGDFTATDLLGAFESDGTVGSDDLPGDPVRDSMSQSQMRTLLNRYGASQAYLVARTPLHVALGQRRGMSDDPDAELLAAFGLARLIAERDSLRSSR